MEEEEEEEEGGADCGGMAAPGVNQFSCIKEKIIL